MVMTREQRKTHAARQDGLNYLAVISSEPAYVRYIVRAVSGNSEIERVDDLTLDDAVAWLRGTGVPTDGRKTLYVAATLNGQPLNAIYKAAPAPGTISDERGYVTISVDDDIEERVRDVEWLEPEYRLEMIARAN